MLSVRLNKLFEEKRYGHTYHVIYFLMCVYFINLMMSDTTQ